jgi:nitrite reductase/ring-hydroxylating ferredoxin subunit
MTKPDEVAVAKWSELSDRKPILVRVGDVDLLVIRYGDQLSVLYGRCPHRGAAMNEARVEGDSLVCIEHGWDFRFTTGVSDANAADCLHRFASRLDRDRDVVLVDRAEVESYIGP